MPSTSERTPDAPRPRQADLRVPLWGLALVVLLLCGAGYALVRFRGDSPGEAPPLVPDQLCKAARSARVLPGDHSDLRDNAESAAQTTRTAEAPHIAGGDEPESTEAPPPSLATGKVAAAEREFIRSIGPMSDVAPLNENPLFNPEGLRLSLERQRLLQERIEDWDRRIHEANAACSAAIKAQALDMIARGDYVDVLPGERFGPKDSPYNAVVVIGGPDGSKGVEFDPSSAPLTAGAESNFENLRRDIIHEARAFFVTYGE